MHYKKNLLDSYSSKQEISGLKQVSNMRDSCRTISDSALAVIKVKDIPDSLHRFVFEKVVPGNNQDSLVVGFPYYIMNVGFSWYLNSYSRGDTFKVIKYSFK